MRLTNTTKDRILGGGGVVGLFVIAVINDGPTPDPLLILGGIILVGILTTITKQVTTMRGVHRGEIHEERKE